MDNDGSDSDSDNDCYYTELKNIPPQDTVVELSGKHRLIYSTIDGAICCYVRELKLDYNRYCSAYDEVRYNLCRLDFLQFTFFVGQYKITDKKSGRILLKKICGGFSGELCRRLFQLYPNILSYDILRNETARHKKLVEQLNACHKTK